MSDLRARTVCELLEMLKDFQVRIEALLWSASDKFKQSEESEWNEDLFQEGMGLLTGAETLRKKLESTSEELESRLDPKTLNELDVLLAHGRGSNEQRWYRKDITTRTVPVTGTIDEILPVALENLLSRVPQHWWNEQRLLAKAQQQELLDQPLLLCGGKRWGTDFTKLHKYGYYLALADAYLKRDPWLDIYSAAMGVPQICCLGTSLESLKGVPGAGRKIRQLSKAPSAETDARIFELLVAAAFVHMGHDLSFAERTFAKTPDLRLHDMPFPTVIECKRKQVLNTYEIEEFQIIRSVFSILCSERERLGLMGELSIDFKKEIVNLPVKVILQGIRDLTNSLSPFNSKETEWGSIYLRPVAVSKKLEPTRLYSPEFLRDVFGLNLELGDYDGICSIVGNNEFPVVDKAEMPLLMKWSSNTAAAVTRKTQTIRNLWIEAVDQIPTGEAGLIYLAYEEGHRPRLADARTDVIRRLADTIYFKRRAISVPMTVISRLFPNVLMEGRPDLIENVIPLVSGGKDDYDFWTADMPTLIFVPKKI